MGEYNKTNERKAMKKVFKGALKLAAVFAPAVVFAAPTFAYGPERTEYTNDNPAPEVVFNSITNNAAVGNEFNFVRVAELGNESKQYVDTLEIQPGKEYEVYIYYHNNAASNLNSSGKGIANGVKVASAYPTVVKRGEKGMISGIISATDSNPLQVWDEAYLTTNYDEVTLRYKTGTAMLHNAGRMNGSILSTDLFTEAGTYIGINRLDGRIPGCAEYSGYITYTIVAENTAASIKKQVSTDGETWYDKVSAKPGEYVTYKVQFKNEGNTNLTNVILKDVHDEGLTLRPGSITIYDANNTSGKTISDILDISGYNFGDATVSALKQIVYQAKVSEDTAYCSKTLKNTITASYNIGKSISDDASVLVHCEETPPEEPTPDPKPDPKPEPDPKPDPGTPDTIVNTGPLEITLATIIVLGIIAGGFYFWRTHRALKTVEGEITGAIKEEKTKEENQSKEEK